MWKWTNVFLLKVTMFNLCTPDFWMCLALFLFYKEDQSLPAFLSFFLFSFFLSFFIVLVCHTSTWIRHGYTRVPNPEPPSHLPPHTIPLGHPSAPALSILLSCIEPGLVIRFIYDIKHVSMPFSQIIPPSPSPTESKRLFYTSVSLLLSRIQGYHFHLFKSHIYALVYCIGVSFFLFFPIHK